MRSGRQGRRVTAQLLSFFLDLATEEEVEGGPNGGDGGELADLLEARCDGGPEDVACKLELESECKEAAQAEPDRHERLGMMSAGAVITNRTKARRRRPR